MKSSSTVVLLVVRGSRAFISIYNLFQSTCILICWAAPLLCPRSERALWRSERAHPDLVSDWLGSQPKTEAGEEGWGSAWF